MRWAAPARRLTSSWYCCRCCCSFAPLFLLLCALASAQRYPLILLLLLILSLLLLLQGPIHPRPKHLLGQRMALSAAKWVYDTEETASPNFKKHGKKDDPDGIGRVWTGPVIANCR